MTSLNGPTSLYIEQEPTIFITKEYARGSVMEYIVRCCPLFAFCVQRAGLDDWFNSDDFGCTVFVPCKEYSDLHLNMFIDFIDVQTARMVVFSALLLNCIPVRALVESEFIPTFDKTRYISIGKIDDKILLNKQVVILKEDVLLKNGIIHIVNGVLIDSELSF